MERNAHSCQEQELDSVQPSMCGEYVLNVYSKILELWLIFALVALIVGGGGGGRYGARGIARFDTETIFVVRGSGPVELHTRFTRLH